MSEGSTTDSAAASVLIIDDSDTNRYIMGSWLRRAGHTVVEAADGTQGLALLAATEGAEQPELAVVDVRLPDMSGFQVCEVIKADPRTAHLPVIHVSATAIDVSDRAQGLYRGADAYLTEPIAPTEFLATVTAALRYARARRRAERLAERIAELNRATLAIYDRQDGRSFAAAAVTAAVSLMSAPAAVLALDTRGSLVHAVAAPGAAPAFHEGEPAQLDRLAEESLGDATGIATATLPGSRWSELSSCGVFADEPEVAVVLARTKRGRAPVLLALPARAVTGDDDRDLLTQLAQTCALALEAQHSFREEHDLALTLQRTFLPGALPSVPGVRMTVRYVPASDRTEIGGDFYEALETPAGLLLVIGDVAGHSLAAAFVMGELRHALRAYVVEGHDPAAVLDRLDTLLTTLHPDVTATVCLVLVDADRRRLRLANAGHLPLLLRHPDGTARYLTEHGTLLGLGVPHPPAVSHPVPAGATLVLFTDGLVEVRGENLDTSLEAFRQAVATGPEAPGQLCDALLDGFGTENSDDIALLAVRLD
ncbi:fused response regulator/phosphatase [Kitasatospora sp. NBC_01287]|uniref:fused response regulator/phosphatase n=1 Tax=Kitasatospora sp. NBC_01287 TaxID=2903573 RepID=UPI002259EA29|nr:fused response regulator/phosphatase [Kitasatospora sp. NBC_01287]MCX4744621.1 fused response regulator/phosphatase [Kitasatospora sp. NBC_01287]